ncbi:MAG: hypothetical protein BWY09_00482 [Candidatus Hydrogenedentes bacterium ADurb.Bin179]|nr:MAG: hypothetical protein BWY09_00482 [Candidatus Hydrogenedentes bacterium ADurb.Bin179]
MIPAAIVRFLPHILGSLAALGVAAWVYSNIWDRGYDSCKEKWNQATAAAMIARDAELDVARLRGEALSAGLAEKERELSNLSREYLTYANSIVGHCPDTLGVLTAAAAAGQTLPAAPGPSPDSAATVGAAAIASNIAENYTRAWDCIARYNAILDWHAGAKGSVTEKKEEK